MDDIHPELPSHIEIASDPMKHREGKGLYAVEDLVWLYHLQREQKLLETVKFRKFQKESQRWWISTD